MPNQTPRKDARPSRAWPAVAVGLWLALAGVAVTGDARGESPR
jgi:hypothetical protein